METQVRKPINLELNFMLHLKIIWELEQVLPLLYFRIRKHQIKSLELSNHSLQTLTQD